jgi:hypothetical protein
MSNTERLQTTSDLLTKGLSEGFAGNADKKRLFIAGVEFERTAFRNFDGGEYVDTWSPKGGFEVAHVNGENEIRLYMGRVVNEATLKRLGITKKDVLNQLKLNLRKLGNKTRLYENCGPIFDGDDEAYSKWRYEHLVLKRDEPFGLQISVETMFYKNENRAWEPVFCHYFMQSIPVSGGK